ncbi:MAG TPA: class I SAM-dependent methyltransferase [Kofleriaceae bacterium]
MHRVFLNDHIRNRAFADAIKRHVKPGSRVIDLGSGTGIWACVAAKAGASQVVAIEYSDLAVEARKTVTRNGLDSIVQVVQDDIRKVELPREFDVVIHELVGGLVWEEDMVELTHYAHEHFLRPGGVLLPGIVRVWMCPWQLANDRPIRSDWNDVCGIDVSHMYDAELAQWRAKRRAYSLNGIDGRGIRAAPCLAHTSRLGIDTQPLPSELRFEFIGDADSIATGVLGYMEIELDPDNVISTGPTDEPTNWGQLYIPAEDTLQIRAGARYEACVTLHALPDRWDVRWRALG